MLKLFDNIIKDVYLQCFLFFIFMNHINLEIDREREREREFKIGVKIVTEVWRLLSIILVFLNVMVFVNNIHRNKKVIGSWGRST